VLCRPPPIEGLVAGRRGGLKGVAGRVGEFAVGEGSMTVMRASRRALRTLLSSEALIF
jgi:hypothetical protein